MSWLWMNMSLAAVFFAAWFGIPLYMVLKHPSWGPQPADSDALPAIEPLPGTNVRHQVLAPALQLD